MVALRPSKYHISLVRSKRYFLNLFPSLCLCYIEKSLFSILHSDEVTRHSKEIISICFIYKIMKCKSAKLFMKQDSAPSSNQVLHNRYLLTSLQHRYLIGANNTGRLLIYLYFTSKSTNHTLCTY